MDVPVRLILVPMGSWGDVYPFLWLGRALAERGHEVRIIINSPFDAAFQAAGLHPVVYGTQEKYEAILQHPDLWHPRRGFPFIARASEELSREIIPRIRAEHVPGRTLLVAAGIAFGARIAAEAFQIPLLTVQMQPAVFLWISPLRVLALFPDWFAPKQADWPPQTVLTRFPPYDEGERMSLAPEVEAFLEAGEPPHLFTPGSANIQAARFFRVALEACTRLNRRGLFVTPRAEQVPPTLPASFLHVPSAPFSRLFPRCAAVVHHGGIGTVAQGLAAGVPQLVMPMSHDQPDNGARLRRLGVGDYLYPRAFRPAAVSARLEHLLTSADVGRACGRYRELMTRQMSTAEVVRAIEACLPAGSAHRGTGER
jgi:UDP:flavonoid glycosyltransferase YjiC (YdhE family)